MRHTKLLNSIWVLFANHNVPWMGTYLKVTAHFSVVPFNRLAAYLYCSIAPSLEVRQRRLICKALEVRADTTQISSVHAIAKCLVQMLPSFLGMNQKLIKLLIANTISTSARRAETGPKRVVMPFGKNTVSTLIPCSFLYPIMLAA